ncbi:AMP-binding protein [Bacillus licheniformis]|nr:AMP-binding protein [Bacillus licheniformis]
MNLVSKLGETAQSKPDRTAYILESKRKHTGIAAEIDCFAEGLREIGVEREIMSLCYSAIHRICDCVYGALKAGAVVIPINPAYTPTEIGYMLTMAMQSDRGSGTAASALRKVHESLPKVGCVVLCETGEPLQEPETQRLR